MSDKPFDDGPSQRAAILQSVEKSLNEAVELMRRKLGLTRTKAEIVQDIKATMYTHLPPDNSTVIGSLWDRCRAHVFNELAEQTCPGVREQFGSTIRDFTTARGTSGRKARVLARNAWKWDPAADRRFREGSVAPSKGRPDVYDRDVVWAFADTIAHAAGRERFATGHHGDETITEKDDKGGPMFRVLVATVRWAMTAAWLGAAPPGTFPPTVKPEGIFSLLKRGRLAKSTD